MVPELENRYYDVNGKVKQSFWGKISILFGIFNLLISIAIFWALHSYVNDEYADIVYVQVQILAIGSRVELLTKPLGLLIGIVGIFEKNKKKGTVFYGILINLLIILWTVILYIFGDKII